MDKPEHSQSCDTIPDVIKSLKNHFGKRLTVIESVGDLDYVLKLICEQKNLGCLRFEIQDSSCLMHFIPIEKCPESTRKYLNGSFSTNFNLDNDFHVSFSCDNLSQMCDKADHWLSTITACQASNDEIKMENAETGSGKSRKTKKHPVKFQENDELSKGTKMRSAQDVIDRLLWDESLNKTLGNWMVGYLDRFTGLQEQQFTEFWWGPFDQSDPMDNAIPRHRIQHFKYRNLKLWDRKAKVDLVFGSVGTVPSELSDVLKLIQLEDEKCDNTPIN